MYNVIEIAEVVKWSECPPRCREIAGSILRPSHAKGVLMKISTPERILVKKRMDWRLFSSNVMINLHDKFEIFAGTRHDLLS